jgi:nucleoside-diphosphate-sugar epimerase
MEVMMKVLIAGASGVVGRGLAPLLVAVGYDVVSLSRTISPAPAGVTAVTADALDRTAVTRVVRDVAPDVVVNLLTAIPRELDSRRFAAQMEPTNRLRIEGTANLIAGAGDARLISEGLAYAYRPAGGLPDEDRPLWTDGPRPFRPTALALVESEKLVAEAGGLVLRFGHLYGPGTVYGENGSFRRQLLAGKMALAGRGPGSTFSFTHVYDAASAIVSAIERPVAGVLNVVDDSPQAIADWLPEMARLLRAPAPRRVPTAIARMVAGAWGVAFLTRLQGADNRRIRRLLDLRPRFPSWKDGFEMDVDLRRGI